MGGSMDDGDAGFEDVEDDDGKEEKKTLKAKLQAVQEVTATVQNAIGKWQVVLKRCPLNWRSLPVLLEQAFCFCLFLGRGKKRAPPTSSEFENIF